MRLLDRPLHLLSFLCEKYIGGGEVVVKGIEEHEREGGVDAVPIPMPLQCGS